jgi:putative FmdB family regulatory protein
MASYDLRCRHCGHDFEVFVQGFLKPEAKVCPRCESREVEQRFTGFQGIFSTKARGATSCADTGTCAPSACKPSAGFG